MNQTTLTIHEKAFDVAVGNSSAKLEPGTKPYELVQGFWYSGMAHGMRVGGETAVKAMKNSFDQWQEDNEEYYSNESDGEGYDSRDDR